jgi:hypothetical protein
LAGAVSKNCARAQPDQNIKIYEKPVSIEERRRLRIIKDTSQDIGFDTQIEGCGPQATVGLRSHLHRQNAGPTADADEKRLIESQVIAREARG